jgi:outer membrane protein insertion porin family
LGETLSINSQLGTRMRSVSTGFTEPYFLDRPLQLGFEAHLTRFDYNQGREASILAGQNLIPLFNALGSNNLLNYIQTGHGFSVSASYPWKRTFSRIGITYGYDISDVKTETTAATSYFDYINFSGIVGPNALSGIRTSRIVPSFSYNTVNHPITPTGGKSLFISTTFAGSILGGNVNTIQPVIEAKYFKPAPWHKSNILAFHLLGSMITGYGGKEIPPFSRTYIGGEQDIRGFQIWGISPIAFIPSEATINVLNNDGSTRNALVKNSYGVLVPTPVTMNIPIYQLAFPGGDTHVVGNFEYRIPIFGPVVLAIFADAGINRILRPSELNMDPARISYLNDAYPTAGFQGKAIVYPGTQAPRMSTGLELQVLLPVVQAPFRVYWAYNPLLVREYLQPPIPADRSVFPNQATFLGSYVAQYGNAYPFFEQHDLFRFTIGRTF